MDDQLSLPGIDPPAAAPGIDLSQPPRLRCVDRRQVCMTPRSLDESLPDDHEVRGVWTIVKGLNLSKFEDKIAARGSAPGRPATDPRILLALWLYASTQGIGAGREIDRLVHCDDRFRWLAGGVTLDYHIINDFRVGHENEVDDLLTQLIAILVHMDLIDVSRIAQDGLRTRASAGSDSFRTEETLMKLRDEARALIESLKQQNDPKHLTRQQAKQLADAQDRARRLDRAVELMPDLQAARDAGCKRRGEEPTPARVSTTDPDARVMKRADGGFRPAYNVQLAVDGKGGAIVGVDVTSEGVDSAQATPMREQVEQRTGQQVKEHLVDGGYASLETIDEAEQAGVKMIAPVSSRSRNRNPEADPYARKKDDTDATFAWRQRMATDEARAIYKERGSMIEPVNGDLAEHRGLRQFRVRGPTKTRCMTLLLALTYDILKFKAELLEWFAACEKR